MIDQISTVSTSCFKCKMSWTTWGNLMKIRSGSKRRKLMIWRMAHRYYTIKLRILKLSVRNELKTELRACSMNWTRVVWRWNKCWTITGSCSSPRSSWSLRHVSLNMHWSRSDVLTVCWRMTLTWRTSKYNNLRLTTNQWAHSSRSSHFRRASYKLSSQPCDPTQSTRMTSWTSWSKLNKR